MSHVRQDLRAAVVAAVTGLAQTQARVHTARVYPLRELDMPALVVNTTSDSAETEGGIDVLYVPRVVTVEVQAYARGANLANTLDTICEQVEVALGAALTVQGKAVQLIYQATEIEFDGEAEQPIGRAAMTFNATLYTASSAPGTLL
jgi:hypothetical protein